MVGVLAEETTVGNTISSLFGKVEWQAGLIIGHIGPKRAHAVAVVPIPNRKNTDNNANPNEGVQGLSSGWVALHANKVRQVLPGGVSVIGVYLFAPRSVVDAQSKLRQLVLSVFNNASYSDKIDQFRDEPSDRVSLHICASTRKTTCRSFDVSQKGEGRPCDWKVQKFLSKWQTLRCDFPLNTTIGFSKSENNGYLNFLQRAMEPHFNQLKQSMMVPSETTKLDLQAVLPDENHINMETLVPPIMEGNENLSVEVKQINHLLCIKGCVQGHAILPPKCTLQQATMALQCDLMRSLTCRINIFCDSLIEEDEEEQDVKDLADIPPMQLPKRVIAHWCSIPLSDYILPFEDNNEYSDTIARIKKLFSIEMAVGNINPVDTVNDNLTHEIGNNMQGNNDKDKNTTSSSGKLAQKSNQVWMLGVIVGVFAIIIAYFLTK